MDRRVVSAVVLALALASGVGCRSGAPDLRGEWEPVTAELSGMSFAISNFNGATLRLTADRYDFGGDKGTISIVSKGHPSRMDIHGLEGPNAGRTIPAIFEYSRGRLTICYQLGNGDRPAAFATEKGSKLLLIHYRRLE